MQQLAATVRVLEASSGTFFSACTVGRARTGMHIASLNVYSSADVVKRVLVCNLSDSSFDHHL